MLQRAAASLLLVILVIVAVAQVGRGDAVRVAGEGERTSAVTLRTGAPGAQLPTAGTCARRVHRHGIEAWRANRRENRTRGRPLVIPRGAWSDFSDWRRLARRVRGNFTGTTDEILQWASCKWGFGADLTRAQAYVESHWRQDFRGDGRQSVGVLQVKAAAPGTPHRYTWPFSRTSTAYNVDYALAWRRACYDGLFAHGGWLPQRSRGDLWGCVGLWYSGNWHEGDADYVADVKRRLSEKPWRAWTDRR